MTDDDWPQFCIVTIVTDSTNFQSPQDLGFGVFSSMQFSLAEGVLHSLCVSNKRYKQTVSGKEHVNPNALEGHLSIL